MTHECGDRPYTPEAVEPYLQNFNQWLGEHAAKHGADPNDVAVRRESFMALELEAANICNQNLSLATAVKDAFHPFSQEYFDATLNSHHKFPLAAAHAAIRRTRRTLMRVASGRYTQALLPIATDLIDPESSTLYEFLGTDALDPWVSLTVPFEGARGRQHEGGHALTAAALTHILSLNVNRTMNEMGPYKDNLVQAISEATLEYARLSHFASEERYNRPIDPELLLDPHSDSSRTREARMRNYAVYATLIEPDVHKLLRDNNVPGQAEFYRVAVSDMTAELRDKGYPVGDRYSMLIRNIGLLSLVASLNNEQSEKLLFDKPHTRLWRLVKSPAGVSTLEGTCPPLVEGLDKKPHICPGPDSLDPANAEHARRSEVFAAKINEIARAKAVDPNKVSAALAVAALAAAVIYVPNPMPRQFSPRPPIDLLRSEALV